MRILYNLFEWFTKLFQFLWNNPSRDTDEPHLNYGIIPDKVDGRDYLVGDIVGEGNVYPEQFQLIDNPKDYVKSQGIWNSCASHAICTAIEIAHEISNTGWHVPLSEKYHWYWAVLWMIQ